MKRTFTLAAALAAVLSGPAANAASGDMDFTVSGVIRPGACTPTLASGGIADFRKISPLVLNPAVATGIGQETVALSVTCAAPAQWALKATDLRAATVTSPNNARFGLGQTPAGENLGFYSISITNAFADGRASTPVSSSNNGAAWSANAFIGPDISSRISALAAPGTTLPLASQVATADLVIAAYIEPTGGLTLTGDVALDGQASIDIFYY